MVAAVMQTTSTYNSIALASLPSIYTQLSGTNMSFIIVFSAIFVLSIAYVVYQRHLHPLAKYPGPFLASISNFWKVQTLLPLSFHRAILHCHEKYGPIVRIGPNDLSFSTPDAIAPIYKSSGRLMPKGEFYNSFVAIRPTMFSLVDEPVSRISPFTHPH
jgi:hypothetical protein